MRAPSTPAGVRWKGVSSAPDSVVGMAATGGAGDAADGLGRVDHAASAQRHQRALAGVGQERRRDLVHQAGGHVQPHGGSSRTLPAARSVVSRV